MDPWVRKFRSGRWAGCSFNRGTSCDASAGVSGAHLGARETRPPDALPLHWPSAASPSFGARGVCGSSRTSRWVATTASRWRRPGLARWPACSTRVDPRNAAQAQIAVPKVPGDGVISWSGGEGPGAGFPGWRGTAILPSIAHRLRPHDRSAAGSLRPADPMNDGGGANVTQRGAAEPLRDAWRLRGAGRACLPVGRSARSRTSSGSRRRPFASERLRGMGHRPETWPVRQWHLVLTGWVWGADLCRVRAAAAGMSARQAARGPVAAARWRRLGSRGLVAADHRGLAWVAGAAGAGPGCRWRGHCRRGLVFGDAGDAGGVLGEDLAAVGGEAVGGAVDRADSAGAASAGDVLEGGAGGQVGEAVVVDVAGGEAPGEHVVGLDGAAGLGE